MSAAAHASSGVSYPSAGDQIAGSTLAAGATASWDYTATMTLSPAQASVLLDPSQTQKVREVFHVETTSTPAGASGPEVDTRTSVSYLTKDLQAESADAQHVSVTITPNTGGARTVNASTVPALGDLAPGATVPVSAADSAAVVAAKGSGESDAQYLARLEGLQGSALTASIAASATTTGVAATGAPQGSGCQVNTNANTVIENPCTSYYGSPARSVGEVTAVAR